ncbi:hypothetical protein ElyMa_002819200 [Elysia marginata]|uniref:Uncharacterized protein n=1 Tax=Elysia marginata TaxID=1093978 RepID=A0AAV4HTV5_9GAST|nr:hypothetical protein ElyMa_002819200 [Elysia marginata]
MRSWKYINQYSLVVHLCRSYKHQRFSCSKGMEFTLNLPEHLEPGTGLIATFWSSLNARLLCHLKTSSNKHAGTPSILSFLGGMSSVERVLISGPLTAGNDEKALELLDTLSVECLPKLLLLYERHKLFTCRQSDSQCACHFLAWVRQQCELCDLGGQSGASLRSRVVEGLANPALQQYFHSLNEKHFSDTVTNHLDLHSAECDEKLLSIVDVDRVGSKNPGGEVGIKTARSAPSPEDLLESTELRRDKLSKVDRELSKNKKSVMFEYPIGTENIGEATKDDIRKSFKRVKQLTQITNFRRKKSQHQFESNKTNKLKAEEQNFSYIPGVKRISTKESGQSMSNTSSGGLSVLNEKGRPKIFETGVRTRSKTHDQSKNTKQIETDLPYISLQARYRKRKDCKETRQTSTVEKTTKQSDCRPAKARHKDNVSSTNSQTNQSRLVTTKHHSVSERSKRGPKPRPPPQEAGILPCDKCHKYFKRDWLAMSQDPPAFLPGHCPVSSLLGLSLLQQ